MDFTEMSTNIPAAGFGVEPGALPVPTTLIRRLLRFARFGTPDDHDDELYAPGNGVKFFEVIDFLEDAAPPGNVLAEEKNQDLNPI